MELGPQADEVLEIVDLVKSGAIFRSPRPPFGSDLKVIRDIADAKNYLHVIANYPEDEGYDWRDLLEYAGEPGSELLVMRERCRKSMIGLTESLNELISGPIAGSLRQQLVGRYTETDLSFILGTIDFILVYRATFGRTLPFIERLVEIYRLGGHPCGWIGFYPEGRLVLNQASPQAF